MKISTQISTQIILNQAELTEAIIEYIKARTDLPSDSKYAVDFEDDVANPNDLTAVVNITAATGGTVVPAATAPSKPAKTRNSTPRATAPATVETAPVAEPVVTAADPDVDTALVNESRANITANPEDRQDPDTAEPLTSEDVPFDVDTPAASGAAPVTKIFAEAHTSAPPTPTEEEPDPATKVKSLFANLAKPAN